MKLPWFIRARRDVLLVTGLGGLSYLVNVGSAQPWAASSPRQWWGAIATSADGSTIVAAAYRHSYFYPTPAPIYVSTNTGESWTQTTAPTNGWSSVACSGDGLRLAAVRGFGFVDAPTLGRGSIYTSPDAGATWMAAKAPTNNWTAVASSADGARLVAVSAPFWDKATTNYVGQGAIYCSLDAGATWTPTTAPSNGWSGVACSADGTRLVAAAGSSFAASVGEGLIYISPDAGVTWRPANVPTNNWTSVASSADGAKLVAVAAPFWDTAGNFVGQSRIYCSSDAGATWTRTATSNTNLWSGVASSADGTKLVAVSIDVRIYRSSDAGATWTAMSAFTYEVDGLGAVACSADGYRLAVGGVSSQIYTWPYSGPWQLASTPSNSWQSIACSADATKLVAADSRFIYTSGDSGATWAQTTAPIDAWSCLASSADGARLLAATASSPYPPYTGGLIYYSSNVGVTWTQTSAPGENWTSVACSTNGTNLVAVAAPLWSGSNYLDGGAIYRSSDAGTTWIRASAPSNVWHSVASSSDGSKLVAGGEGTVYRSVDAGATWIPTDLPSGSWNSVASSADGTKLVALLGALWDPAAGMYAGGAIYQSSDGGATWVRANAPARDWFAVVSSADGTVLCALQDEWDSNMEPEISTNSGASWAPASVPYGWWNSVAASADGSYILVAGYGQIVTLRSPARVPPTPPSPRLALDRSEGNYRLSWQVPSTPFVLQENSSLGPTHWVAVATPPSLNLTNLHYELALPLTPANLFYRLKQQ